MRHIGIVALFILTGCANIPRLPPLGGATIINPSSFLAPDGVTAETVQTVRRRDLPRPDGYQFTDAWRADDGSYVSAFSFGPPHAAEAFNPARGDGGEVYVIEGPTVRITETQDGGKPYLQVFTGPQCGGTGWILFRNDAPTGRWASMVASLGDPPPGGGCSAGSRSFSRYRLETVALQWGTETRIAPTVISEHYNRASLSASTEMERSFFVQGVGRAVWEAWGRNGSRGASLDIRCPPTAYSVPPSAGWQLLDCRYATNDVVTNPFTGAAYGWPISNK